MTGGTVLVTGAAGFAGSHLLDLLTHGADSHAGSPEAGGNLVAWRRNGRSVVPHPEVQWQAIDLLDRAAVGDAIAQLRPRLVYHLAGAAHVGRSWEHTEATFATNVRGTHHLVEALSRAGEPVRVLIASSALAYRPAQEPLTEEHPLIPVGPYGLSKLAQEMVAGQANGPVSCAIARAFNHFGPRQDPGFSTSGFARQIAAIEAGLQPPEITVGNLDARRDFTDVRDTVRAYRTIAERGLPSRAYNVCSGRAVAIGDLLDMLIARARVAVRVKVDPGRFRPSDLPLLLGDPRRLREELGWMPALPIERTLDDLLDYWRGQIVRE